MKDVRLSFIHVGFGNLDIIKFLLENRKESYMVSYGSLWLFIYSKKN